VNVNPGEGLSKYVQDFGADSIKAKKLVFFKAFPCPQHLVDINWRCRAISLAYDRYAEAEERVGRTGASGC